MVRAEEISSQLNRTYRASLRYAKHAGFVLTIAALLFVGWSLYRSELLTSHIWLDPHFWKIVLLGALSYGLALIPIGLSWLLLINSATRERIGVLDGLSLYATTALYKYLPSNVLHYVGRHASLRTRGVEHSTAVWGALAETGLMLAAAALVAAVAGFAAFRDMLARSSLSIETYWPLLLVLAAFGAAAALILVMFFRETLERFLKPSVFAACVLGLVVYCAFFAITGLIFWRVTASIADSATIDGLTLVALWAAAWSIGFVTPGASAGIGIREALLIGGLTAAGLPDGAPLIAIAFRLITTLGDFLFGGLSWIVSRFDSS